MDTFRAAEQIGHLAHHFEAVVCLGVVRGGDHHTGQVHLCAREVELVGADHADIDYVRALIGNSVRDSLEHLRTAQTHVAPHQYRLGSEKSDKCSTNQISRLFVQVGRINAADVIRLEDSRINLHVLFLHCRFSRAMLARCCLYNSIYAFLVVLQNC